MMINSLKIRELKQSIVTHLEKQDVPLEVQRMILKEALEDVTQKANAEIIAQIQERDRKEEEEYAESV